MAGRCKQAWSNNVEPLPPMRLLVYQSPRRCTPESSYRVASLVERATFGQREG